MVALIAVTSTNLVHADVGDRGGAVRIAIEAYVGVRPSAVERPVELFRRALAARNFVVYPADLEKMMGGYRVRPGIVNPQFTSQKLAAAVDKGVNEFINADPKKDADFQKVVSTLGQAVGEAERNPGMLAREPKHRETMLSAYVHLALAYDRLRNMTRRDEVMSAAIRYFPKRVITRNQHGPEAERIFQANRSNIDKMGRGRLVIQVSEPDAVIYLDEIAHGSGSLTIGDLIPGKHRVLVVSQDGESRQYEVSIFAKQETRHKVDWALDSVLSSGDWVGLLYATASDRAREADLVRRFARAHTSAAMAATYSVTAIRNRVVIEASLYRVATGALIRSKAVELDGTGDENRVTQLAAALVNEPTQGGIIVDVDHPEHSRATDTAKAGTEPQGPEPVASVAAVDTGSPAPMIAGNIWRRPMASLAGAMGIFYAATGGALLAGCKDVVISLDCSRNQAELGGWIFLSSGLALVGVSAYVMWSDSRPRPARPIVTMSPLAGGGMGSVQFEF
ncbi:MAG: hypothetical protein WKG01_11110 [Kofleriaceae bacterium]